MAPLLLLAILPFDLLAPVPAPTANGLRLEASVQNRRVYGVLVNVGDQPIEVVVGADFCGAEPFEAIVDEAPRSFRHPHECIEGGIERAVLLPHERREVPSQSIVLDDAAHVVQVRYRAKLAGAWRGELTTAVVLVPAAPPGDAGPPPQLTRGDIVVGMVPVNARVHACFAQYKLPGTAVVAMLIDRTGTVQSAAVTGRFVGTPTGECIARAVRSASFRKFSGSPMSISYPFILR